MRRRPECWGVLWSDLRTARGGLLDSGRSGSSPEQPRDYPGPGPRVVQPTARALHGSYPCHHLRSGRRSSVKADDLAGEHDPRGRQGFSASAPSASISGALSATLSASASSKSSSATGYGATLPNARGFENDAPRSPGSGSIRWVCCSKFRLSNASGLPGVSYWANWPTSSQ